MSWKVTTLENHVDLISGPAFKSAKFSDNPDDIPLIKGENLSQQKILWEKSRYWPVNEVAGYEKYFLEEGDVVLAMDRPWVPAGLKYAWIQKADPKALLVQRVARLKGINGLSTDFLRYIIGSQKFSQYIKGIMGGTNVPHISGDQIKAFQFQLPSQTEQKRIVSILSPYDDLIENNRRRIQLLEEAARLLYQEWFVRLRFPGHENTKIVDGVPEGWESLSLIEALELQRGFDLPLKNIEPGDVPVYGSTGIIGYHNVSKVKGPGIITGRSGSLGIVQYVLNDYWPHNTALWVKTFKKVTPLFALYLLRNLKLEQYNGGVSVPTLDRKVVHRIQIIIPPPRIMNEFESSCSDSYALMMNLSQQNTNLIKARDLLIPRLMNGVIPV